MAGWEDELSVLLSELGVKQEEPQAHMQQSCKPRCGDSAYSSNDTHYGDSDDMWLDQLPDGAWSDVEHSLSDDDDEPWVDDIDMMRHEVDSIVSQVILLMQRGDLDAALKEDVMVVLRALRHRLPLTQQPIVSDEAYLESASALLHFCRLVLQLSDFSADDM
jgi:hypothetical protein